MDIVNSVVTQIVESLLVPVKRHLGFICSSTDKVKEMHTKLAELDGAKHDICNKQESSKVNRRSIPHRVPDWLEEVNEIEGRAEKVPKGRVGCFNLKMRYKAGKDSSYIFKDINRLLDEKNGMVWTDEVLPLGVLSPPRPSTSGTIDEVIQNKSGIESRDLIVNDVLKSLDPNNIKTQKMALCGMGGIGKTTMMEQVRKVATDRGMFSLVVNLVVGQKVDIIALQQTVVEYTGGSLTETTRHTRAECLKKIFEVRSEEGKRKILVILDDVWEEFNLKDIGLASPLPNGFKLLMASREESVCTRMGVSLIFKIDVLKDLEAEQLFWDIIGVASSTDIEPDLYKIGEDIIKRCAGLPIAINTIASTLRDITEKNEWKDARFRIHNQEFPVLINIFEFSYKNLKEDDLKATFILSGLFPEDHNISIENLVMYSWGLKIFKNVHSIAIARSRVNTHVNKLIRSNLLIRSDREGCVKMHDLVRDFVLSSFSKVKRASVLNHDSNVSEQFKEEESYKRILLKCEGMTEFPVDFDHTNLSLLKLMEGDKPLRLPEDFYTRMNKLEVVACENFQQPLLLQYSTNLRALCLSSCSLVDNDISFLGDLTNLEVLSLVSCGIKKLPSKIGNLKRLKLLGLGESHNLHVDDGVFQNLKELEELYSGFTYGCSICFTDANCNEFKELSKQLSTLELQFFENKIQPIHVSFESLERFRISMGCRLETNKYEYSFKNTLILVISKGELVECKINELFSKTEILHLEVNDMHYLEDILMHPLQNSFCNLNTLHISGCASLTYLFTLPVAKGLVKLETIKIKSCSLLKSMVNSENNETATITFHKLKVLSLGDLESFISLCDPINVIKLPQLTELKLTELPNIASIFPKNNTNILTERPFFINEDMIPKMEKLILHKMENLMEIWACDITSSEEEVQQTSVLRKIEVDACNRLVNLFQSNPMQKLSHLEELTIKECGSLEVLFNIDLSKMKHHNNNIIWSKIEVSSCASFREVWRIKEIEINHSGHLISHFQAVECIIISECNMFRNMVTPTTTNFDIRALKDISIRSCGKDGKRNYELVKNSQQINSMSKEGTSIAFPSYQITHNLHDLLTVEFNNFEGVEVVFEIESPSNQDQLVTLPNLEKLDLKYMDALSHVWKCNNWNEFFILHERHPQTTSSFQNLTTIHMYECKNIKYLFSSLMVKLLSNLKDVEISFCRDMEEVVSYRDDEIMASASAHTTTCTLLPHLQHLKVTCLENLNHIGGGLAKSSSNVSHGQSEFSQLDVTYWSLCQYTQKLDIEICNALSIVIPYYIAGPMQKLQELSIRYCSSMIEVFGTKDINNDGCGSSSSSSTAVIPRPIISTTHKLPNLKMLKINGCERLESVFTFSILETLKELEKLTIKDCKALKVVVREDYTSTLMSKDVSFPRLKSIKLDKLPNLEGFFMGMNINFQWPQLDKVKIKFCPEMMVFTAGQSEAPMLKYIQTELGKHNVEGIRNFHVAKKASTNLDGINSCPIISKGRLLAFHNLIELNSDRYCEKICSSNELQQLQKLEKIHIDLNIFAEELFEVVALEEPNSESQTTVVEFPMLREVELKYMRSLKYLWKSNPWRTLKFPNLTRLSIKNCDDLEHVFTCSMVGSVMQLKELSIGLCAIMKVVIKEEEDHDARASEIKFPYLKSLELDHLSSVEGFFLGKNDFAFPSLDTLVVKECPRMTVFTGGRSVAPKLSAIETTYGSFDVNYGEDINSFIMIKQQEGSSFGGKYDESSSEHDGRPTRENDELSRRGRVQRFGGRLGRR